jgi:hypothetical protein
VSVPEEVRDSLKMRLWELADQIGWINLPTSQKSKQYENWTRNPEIGGLLGRFMDRGKVRLYIKDTLLKGYGLERSADPRRPLRVVGIEPTAEVLEEYVKPHGRRFGDGRIISWGRAEDWKSILMAVHERAFLCKGARPYAVVLAFADGRFREAANRSMVQAAADKLGVEKLVWLDT